MKRNPVNPLFNVWFDSEAVSDEDLSLEQQANITVQADIIGNHVGAGALPETLNQNVIFDSSLAIGFLDGVAVFPQNQPSDNNFGNQLEIGLTDSKAAGKRAVKVAIIGLDFQNNLQYETFYFRNNEVQVSKKHFIKVLVLLFNDLLGNSNFSFNLGGRLVIKETKPLTLSRDPIMVSQSIEPNLFFRDFFLDGFLTLNGLLKSALPFYNVDSLNIFTSSKEEKVLLNGDVVTQIGQKFQATTNNIQKVTFLMSVRNTVIGSETDLAWDGDLVVSIYPLQSNVDCITDIAPNLPIDFPPANGPLAQISFNYNTLSASGTVLDSVPQPVDFIFSNSLVGSGNAIIPGNYYAVTIKRSGAATKCDIMLSAGNDWTSNSRLTTFTGNLWVDIPEDDLWFKIWTDAAKVSDGQAYESGHGIAIPKTELDPITETTADFVLDSIQFTGNEVLRAVVAAAVEESVPVPDQRTGNPVLSRQQFVPKISLLNNIDITNLEKASDPLIIGAIADKNIKFFDAVNSTISSKLHSASLVNNELLIRVVTDPTDTGRFDTSVINLVSDLLNGNFVGAKFIPNNNNPSVFYRVAEARLCSMIVGDVNGDGIVDNHDLDLLNTYIGYDLNAGLPLNTSITTNGINTTYTNGYTTYTKPFSNLFGISFQVVDPVTTNVVASGSDGVLVANPSDNRLAQFTSASVIFNSIVGLNGYKLVILSPVVAEDHGAFDITNIDSLTDVLTIRKVFLTGDVIGQLFRADIDGDFHVTNNDGYLLQSYIDRLPLTFSPLTPFPAPATNAYTNIGTKFNVIRFKLEEFTDRIDDYSSVTVGRPGVVHPVQDIFVADGYYASHNFYTSPSIISVQKQLTWDEALIVTNSRTKLVPSVFETLSGFESPECALFGIHCDVYNNKPDFDPGRVDYFIPNNLIIGEGGELKRPTGDFYKVDFEVGTIVLEIPDGLFGSERTINILDTFIASALDPSTQKPTGITSFGFPAMKFSDCTYVTSDALLNDQLRFSVAVQSFSPNTAGLSQDGYSGAIVDGKMGVAIDYSTGLLTLNFTNLFQDVLLATLSTKVQIHVFLKKGGFNNTPVFIDSTKVQNMLSLISVFSGAVDGGPSALVDLGADVMGVLPLVHGGTGLSTVGASGTVLMSNGTGLSYQFITSANVQYTASTPGNWAGTPPTTVQSAIDRIAASIFTHWGAIP